MGKVNVIVVDATGNKEQKVGLPDDIKCGIIMVKLVEKIKLPSVGPDGNPISYKFIHKVTGKQLLETQTLAEAGIRDGDVLRLQPEITAGAVCPACGRVNLIDGIAFCPGCGTALPTSSNTAPAVEAQPQTVPTVSSGFAPVAVKTSKGNKQVGLIITYLLGLFSGIASVLFGFIISGMDVGYYESAKSYGGDAYTGIQNAAAQTADNVHVLCELVREGFMFVLFAIGAIAVFYFASKIISTLSKNK